LKMKMLERSLVVAAALAPMAWVHAGESKFEASLKPVGGLQRSVVVYLNEYGPGKTMPKQTVLEVNKLKPADQTEIRDCINKQLDVLDNILQDEARKKALESMDLKLAAISFSKKVEIGKPTPTDANPKDLKPWAQLYPFLQQVRGSNPPQYREYNYFQLRLQTLPEFKNDFKFDNAKGERPTMRELAIRVMIGTKGNCEYADDSAALSTALDDQIKMFKARYPEEASK
jgi:hypothetical protein